MRPPAWRGAKCGRAVLTAVVAGMLHSRYPGRGFGGESAAPIWLGRAACPALQAGAGSSGGGGLVRRVRHECRSPICAGGERAAANSNHGSRVPGMWELHHYRSGT